MEKWQEKERRIYHRAGEIAAAVYNCHRDSKRHPQPISWHDIFPGFKSEEEPIEANEAQIDLFFRGILASRKKGYDA